MRLDVDQKVDGLKVSVKLEMEENERLEKMLEAALKWFKCYEKAPLLFDLLELFVEITQPFDLQTH